MSGIRKNSFLSIYSEIVFIGVKLGLYAAHIYPIIPISIQKIPPNATKSLKIKPRKKKRYKEWTHTSL